MRERLMVRRTTGTYEIRNIAGRVEQLADALRLLFDLLESYAPIWYSERHHKIASAALANVTDIEQIFEPKLRLTASTRKGRNTKNG